MRKTMLAVLLLAAAPCVFAQSVKPGSVTDERAKIELERARLEADRQRLRADQERLRADRERLRADRERAQRDRERNDPRATTNPRPNDQPARATIYRKQ